MTRAKLNTRNSEFYTQVLKGELFRLASIDLLGVSLSEGKPFAFTQVYFCAKRLSFQSYSFAFESESGNAQLVIRPQTCGINPK
jgi:hypothetical protein